MIRAVLAAAVLIAAASAAALASPAAPVPGSVILVRSGAVDAYVWNASSYVAELVNERTLGEDGMRALEASALAALAQKARTSRAKTLTMSVVYKPPSATSIYGTPTSSGQQKLFVLTVSRAAVAKSGAAWARSVAGGNIPPQVHLKTAGTLPPAQ